MYQVRSTKYGLEFFPHLANSYHRPDTFSMSYAQPRSKNVEVGIRVLTQMVLRTLPACRRQVLCTKKRG